MSTEQRRRLIANVNAVYANIGNALLSLRESTPGSAAQEHHLQRLEGYVERLDWLAAQCAVLREGPPVDTAIGPSELVPRH